MPTKAPTKARKHESQKSGPDVCKQNDRNAREMITCSQRRNLSAARNRGY